MLLLTPGAQEGLRKTVIMETGFKRETLPQDIEAFRSDAGRLAQQAFAASLGCPALLYARSKLWDPLLIMAAKRDDNEGTQLVSYDIVAGGYTFLSPIRKRRTEPLDSSIYLGRAPDNDLVVPVATVSSRHAIFQPPPPGKKNWIVTDLNSRNGTFLNETQLDPQVPTEVADGEYLRLGGNLIAWFIHSDRLWSILRNPAELSRLTDL